MGRFLLARALWDSGGAKAKAEALRLATETRGLLEDTGPESSPVRKDLSA